MSKLRTVDVWPHGGHEHWCEHPDDDAFARSAQRITSLYNEVLPSLELSIRVSYLRIVVGLRDERLLDPDAPAMVDQVHVERRDGLHMTHVYIPPGVANLSVNARGLLALDVIDHALRKLATAVGWDPDRLAPVRAHALAKDLEFHWEGPWKRSPDRKHRARVVFRVDDDGWGRGRIEVADGTTTRSSSAFVVCGNEMRLLRAIAKDLRWEGSDAVVHTLAGRGPRTPAERRQLEQRLEQIQVDYPHTDWGDVDVMFAHVGSLFEAITPEPSRLTLAELGEEMWPAPASEPDERRPAVVDFIPQPSPLDRLEVHGGGDLAFRPRDYTNSLLQFLDGLRSSAWQEWWTAAGCGPLEVHFNLGWCPSIVKYDVRRVRDIGQPESGCKFVATVSRAYDSVPSDVDPVEFARADVVALMDKVRKRADLPSMPEVVAGEPFDF